LLSAKISFKIALQTYGTEVEALIAALLSARANAFLSNRITLLGEAFLIY
jgi:ABC-type amino acid transport substrate-binding protein